MVSGCRRVPAPPARMIPLREVDEINNLACAASSMGYQFDRVQTIQTSVQGAVNVLGLSRKRSVVSLPDCRRFMLHSHIAK